jgi:5-methylcytosine-specific restriction endonuclease McrA
MPTPHFQKGNKIGPRFQKGNAVNKGRTPWNKGISTAAIGKSRPQTKKLCVVCGNIFAVRHLKAKFCSFECFKIDLIERNKRNSGKNHYNWKGGITPLNHRVRTSTRAKLWRQAVLKRDNYTCVNCGAKENLEVDHIKQFAYHPNLRFELSNGRTLCKNCHKKTDTHSNKILT